MEQLSIWAISFLLTNLVEGMIITAFESYVMAEYALSVPSDTLSKAANRTIPTYLALFIFAFFFNIAMSWDAIRLKNTIQLLGLNLFQVAMLVYSAIQIEQIHDAINVTAEATPLHFDPWPRVKPFLIAVPCVIALTTIILAFTTWKLYQEFGWSIYKYVGASVPMRRRYFIYQIFVALLKFDFFFFLGYEIQSLVIIISIHDAEFGITIAAIPVTVIILLFTAWSVRHESLPGMIVCIGFFFGGLAYFLFKLIRMYQPSQAFKYIHARAPLTSFAVITVVCIVCTIINAIMCTMNFNKGLDAIILEKGNSSKRMSTSPTTQLGHLSRRKPEEEAMDEENYLHPKIPQTRMVIE